MTAMWTGPVIYTVYHLPIHIYKYKKEEKEMIRMVRVITVSAMQFLLYALWENRDFNLSFSEYFNSTDGSIHPSSIWDGQIASG